jgi:hypothetical protein
LRIVLRIVLCIVLCIVSCIVLCIVSPHACSYLFFIFVQFYRPLSLGGKPIAVYKYHMYQTKINENLSVVEMLLGGSTRASLRNTSIFL